MQIPDSLEARVQQPCPNIRPIQSVKPTHFIGMSSSFLFFFPLDSITYIFDVIAMTE